MNYQKHYDNLMKTRKQFTSFGNLEYWEKHHIIPRCLGGTNDPENLVLLTAREHYIAHWLLWKATGNRKLGHAFTAMQGKKNNRKYTAYQYEKIRQVLKVLTGIVHKGKKISEETRQKFCIAAKERMTDQMKKHLSEKNKGTKHTQEAIQKIKEARKKQKISEDHLEKMRAGKSKEMSEETKNKIREARKNQAPISEEGKQRIRDALKKRVFTDEYRQKLKEARLKYWERKRRNVS